MGTEDYGHIYNFEICLWKLCIHNVIQIDGELIFRENAELLCGIICDWEIASKNMGGSMIGLWYPLASSMYLTSSILHSCSRCLLSLPPLLWMYGVWLPVLLQVAVAFVTTTSAPYWQHISVRHNRCMLLDRCSGSILHKSVMFEEELFKDVVEFYCLFL